MPSQIVQTLITELTADGAKLRAELAKSNKDLTTWGAKVTNSAKKIGIGLGATGVGAAAGLAALTKSAIDNADAISKQSQIVGIDTENLSKLKYAADLSDVSFEALGKGLVKFNKGIVEARSGTGAQADAFTSLGVSLKNADGSWKSTNQLVEEVADQFSRFEDGATKTALATDLFGKSGADLIPMLNGGRQTIKEAGDELERMGGVIDEKTGLAAERFNDNINRLEKSLSSMGMVIAKDVTEPLADMSEVFADPETQKGIASIASGIVSIGAAAVEALGSVGSFSKFLGEEFARTIHGVASDDIPGLEDRLQQLKAQVDPKNFMDWMNNSNMGDFFTGKGKLLAEIESVKKQIAAAYAAKSAADNKSTSKPYDDKWAAEADAAYESEMLSIRLANKKATEEANKKRIADQTAINELVDRELASMKEQLVITSDSTELEKIQYRERFGDLKNASTIQKQNLETAAQEIDVQKELNELKKWAVEQDGERLELENLLLTETQKVNKAWDDRIAKMKQLGMGDDAILKAEAKRKEELDTIGKKGVDDLSEYSKQAARNMQSAFADFLFDPFEDGLDGLLKSFARTVQRMVAEWAAAQIFNGIGDWGQQNKGGAGVLGLLAQGASMFGGMFAEGGRPPMGKVSVVGDGGEPELFVPDTAGTIIPFSKLGGGGDTFHFGNLVFPGVTNAREAELAAGAAGRQLLGMLNKSRRYS